MVTKKEDFTTYKGTVTNVEEIVTEEKKEMQIIVEKSKNNKEKFTERMIRFLEILN